jgi:hypothetical protein
MLDLSFLARSNYMFAENPLLVKIHTGSRMGVTIVRRHLCADALAFRERGLAWVGMESLRLPLEGQGEGGRARPPGFGFLPPGR